MFTILQENNPLFCPFLHSFVLNALKDILLDLDGLRVRWGREREAKEVCILNKNLILTLILLSFC